MVSEDAWARCNCKSPPRSSYCGAAPDISGSDHSGRASSNAGITEPVEADVSQVASAIRACWGFCFLPPLLPQELALWRKMLRGGQSSERVERIQSNVPEDVSQEVSSYVAADDSASAPNKGSEVREVCGD